MTDVPCSHPGCHKPAVGVNANAPLCARHWQRLADVHRQRTESTSRVRKRCPLCGFRIRGLNHNEGQHHKRALVKCDTPGKLNTAVLRAAFDAGKQR